MYQPVKISPSILSADFMNMQRDIREIEEAGADWIHVDVMDGHFVPNLTLGVPFVKQLKSIAHIPLDVHLMIDNPLEELPWFCACEPQVVTVHAEALDFEAGEAQKAIDLIHSCGASAGVSIKPDTPVSAIADTIGLWDMVLVMSVYPGFSGQSFIPESEQRTAELARLCTQSGCKPLIQVDGGIGEATAPKVCAGGADVLVAGNAVFKAADRAEAIAAIRAAGLAAQAGKGCARD